MVVELNGRIIRPIGKEFENTGILIVKSRRVKSTNMISAYVKYFRLDLNPDTDFVHISDSEFKCPFQYFLSNFELLQGSIHNPSWVRMGAPK